MRGKPKDQRTQKMMEEFYNLKKDGKSIAEIAENFNLSKATIYNALQEIAEKNGVNKEELLDFPHKKHVITKAKNALSHDNIEPQDLKCHFDSMLSDAQEIISKIDDILKSAEAMEEV